MFSKLNGKLLTAVMVILLGLFLFSTFYGPGSTKRTFPDQLLVLDSAAVNSIVITTKNEGHEPFTLERSDSSWTVKKDGSEFATEKGRVPSLLQGFKVLKPQRLAGRDETSWSKFEVTDSLGSHVMFSSENGEQHSIIVGKFTYDQATQQGTSFVRLDGEPETYAVDGFLRMAVDQPLNAWRNKLIIQGNENSWKEMHFSYPADSGFVLTKVGSQWALNGALCDSARVALYLSTIANIQSLNFVDDLSMSSEPDYVARFVPNGMGEPVTIEAFPVAGSSEYLIRSSLNPNSLFSNDETQLVSKLFQPYQAFETVFAQ